MTAEPSGWHVFGDPVEPAGAEAAPAARTAPAASGRTASPRSSAGAASLRPALLAVGTAVAVAVVGVVVFLATVGTAMGGHPDNVVIAARNQATQRPSAPAAVAFESSQPLADAPVLVVDVEGAVRSPGLHHVPAGSRIGDAITAAGGYADRADLAAAATSLNLAEALSDGAKIRVPLLGEAHVTTVDGGPRPTSGSATGGSGQPAGLIDLNHADQAGLESLPGIGPVTAAKIIAARESGPFASLDDVVSRKALSASVLTKIRSLVTVTP